MDQLGYACLAENNAWHWWYDGHRAILTGVHGRYLDEGSVRSGPSIVTVATSKVQQ